MHHHIRYLFVVKYANTNIFSYPSLINRAYILLEVVNPLLIQFSNSICVVCNRKYQRTQITKGKYENKNQEFPLLTNSASNANASAHHPQYPYRAWMKATENNGVSWSEDTDKLWKWESGKVWKTIIPILQPLQFFKRMSFMIVIHNIYFKYLMVL